MLFVVLSSTACLLTSCQKYLDAKSDQSIATPTTIADLEGMLDNYAFLNNKLPSAGEVASDCFYLVDADWASLSDRQRFFYAWQKTDDIGADYTGPYNTIAYTNIMLETLPKTGSTDMARNNNIEGGAKFVRAECHFALAQLFAKPYLSATANTDPGIAIRSTSDPEILPVRSSIASTYSAILSDLQSAARLLPVIPKIKSRPSKPAAYGLLARVYLSMRDYINAGLYADSCLQLYSKLIDHNTVSTTSTIPFAQFNDEVIYDCKSSPPSALTVTKARVDTTLYASYATNDLRKAIYFGNNANGSHFFKGNYTGASNASVFTGIATDEMYLIKAECAVRTANINLALQTLNQLLATRWKSGAYNNITVSDPSALLTLILQERKKELLFREIRWADLRRLNQEATYRQTIYRKLNGVLLTLDPGSDRYVFEIDINAVNISGLAQNP